MRNWLQKCPLSIAILIVFILAVGLIVGCGAATTLPPPLPTPSSFSYLVQVQAKDTGQKVESAEVIISVGGRVPLDSFTDSKGIARIIIPSNYVNEPGVLAVEAKEFKEYTQNIDLVEGALPDDIRLERLATAINAPTPTPIAPLTPTINPSSTVEPTVEPTDIPTTVPTNTPTTILTDTPTPTPTEEEQPTEVTMLVEAQDTGQGISGAQVEIKVSGEALINVTTDSQGNVTISIFPSFMGQSAELSVEATGFQNYSEIVDLTEEALPGVIQLERLLPTATPRVTGRLAVPLMLGLNPKVYLVDTTGTLIGAVDGQQPDFTRDSEQLIINGGGGISMLYRTDREGNFLATVGDPGLTEHAHPAWSPDGTQVIYDDSSITPPSWHIFKRGLDDTVGAGEGVMTAALRPILDPNPLYPLWTTQNRFIFRSCNTWGDGGQCGLWIMQDNLGEPERLTNNFNHIPTDVDGNTLVYVSQEAGDWNVYTLDIETKVIQQLTFNTAADSLATISPDGNWVAFLSNREGRLAVWTVSIDGSSVNWMFDINPQWGTLRSDGWSEEKLTWGQ